MSHLTQKQRYTIDVLNKKKYSQTAIGEIIGKDKSVVCRELKRNCDKRNGDYRGDLAHSKCKKRHCDKNKHISFNGTYF